MPLPIYCNLCNATREEIPRKYFITSCSHVLCENCTVPEKNFCKVCSTTCKLIEINKQMPQEIKTYFEDSKVDQMVGTILKIHNFQNNQFKLFCEQQQNYTKKYSEQKTFLIQMNDLKEKLTSEVKKEKTRREVLKQAYHSNKITPDLFEWKGANVTSSGSTRSPSVISQNTSASRPSSSQRRLSDKLAMPSNSSPYSSAARPPAISSSASSSSIVSKMLTPLRNLFPKPRDPSQRSPSAISQAHSRDQIYQKTQQNLLHNTLQQMQRESQMNYEAMRQKTKRF